MLHCDWGQKVRGLEGKEKGGGRINETGLGRSLAYTGGSFSTWREGYNNVTWWLDCSIQSNSAHLQTESFHQLCTVSQTIYINSLFNELYIFNFFFVCTVWTSEWSINNSGLNCFTVQHFMRVSSEDRFLHLLALHQRCSLSTTFHFQKQSQRRPEIIQMIRIIEDHTNGNQFTMLNTYDIYVR